MSFPRSRVAGVLAVACALAIAACGSSSNDSGGSSAGAGGSKSADVAAAKAAIAPFTGHPSPFPITTPLKKRPTGKRIAYLDCGTPVCGLFYPLAQPAAQSLGMTLTRIKSGLTADSVAAAFNTVIEQGYDGVFVPALQPSLWQRSLAELNAKHIPVVTTGVTGGDKSKIGVMQLSDTAVKRAGKLAADWVVAKNGDNTDVVFYVTPEIAFINVMGQAFTAEVNKLCPGCKVRTKDLPAATLGNKAPSLIVDDLQAAPDTKTAVFGTSEQTQGLPQALNTAGIKIQTLGNIPDPGTLQYIQEGKIDAGLGVDIPVDTWTLIDSLARLTTGQPAAPGAKADKPPMMFLTKDVLAGRDVSRGWTGYPDFAARFNKLWASASK